MTEQKIKVRALLCPHCGHIDDLVPHPKTGASRRCPCPHDEVTSRQRRIEVDMRHRAAVARAAERDRWTRWRAQQEAS